MRCVWTSFTFYKDAIYRTVALYINNATSAVYLRPVYRPTGHSLQDL